MDFDCDDFEKTLKVIVVGNGNVGKTSMTTRYAKGKYTGNYKKTIGVDFMEKSVELRDLGETVNLMIWDTAGQEEFDALTSRYYKGAGAVIYVFSTVDRDSFDDLPKWKRKVEEECGRICQVLVQNKIDLIEDAAMSRAEVEDMADYMNIKLYRSCVQDNINVKEVFEHLCRQFLKYGSGGSGDENLQVVADISTLSEVMQKAAVREASQSDRKIRREMSEISDSGSNVSDDYPPSPPRAASNSRRSEGRKASPPAHASHDRESRRHARDSDDEDDRRRVDRQDDDDSDENDDSDKQEDRRRRVEQINSSPPKANTKAKEKTIDRDPKASPNEDLSDREAHNDSESDAVGEEDQNQDDLFERQSDASSQPAILQPSKQRTNGKKRQSVPECRMS